MVTRDESNTQGQRDGLQDAALVMAMAILKERVRRLPKDDRQDMYELTQVLFQAETEEEINSAVAAMREILEQAPLSVVPLEPAPQEGEGLRKWMTWIGERIRAARDAAGLTQEALAARSGLPQSHISRLENGKHSPSRVTLEKIAAALNVPLTQLDPSA